MSVPRENEALSASRSRKRPLFFAICLGMALMLARSIATAQERPAFDHDRDHDRDRIHTMWIDHLVFLPGDPSVQTSFNAVNSGVGGGLSGLIITSSTLGSEAQGGGTKGIETALQIPPDFQIVTVRVCYETSIQRNSITQTALSH